MHFYKFFINDYMVTTRHLTNEEDLCLRRLIDFYYTEEELVPLDTQWVARRIQIAPEVVSVVLLEFFTETVDGWSNSKADLEIASYHAICEKNRSNGKRGVRPSGSKAKAKRKPLASDRSATADQSGIRDHGSISPVVPAGDVDGTDGSSEHSDSEYSADFNSFWSEFPEKKGKGAAWRAWQKAKRPSMASLVAAIRLQSVDRAAAKAKGEFYPEWKNPATWISSACWEDGLKYAAKKEKGAVASPARWRETLVEIFPENFPQGLASAGFPSSFALLPSSVQDEIRAKKEAA